MLEKVCGHIGDSNVSRFCCLGLPLRKQEQSARAGFLNPFTAHRPTARHLSYPIDIDLRVAIVRLEKRGRRVQLPHARKTGPRINWRNRCRKGHYRARLAPSPRFRFPP